MFFSKLWNILKPTELQSYNLMAYANLEQVMAFALELLDQLVEQDLKPLVHALVEEMHLASRFRRLDAFLPIAAHHAMMYTFS